MPGASSADMQVPSLYVRVYRSDIDDRQGRGRSLIICEGISQKNGRQTQNAAFPHYM